MSILSKLGKEVREELVELNSKIDSINSSSGGDKPIFSAVGNGTDYRYSTILGWSPVVDTDNAFKNGIWTCPKDGYYEISASFTLRHS